MIKKYKRKEKNHEIIIQFIELLVNMKYMMIILKNLITYNFQCILNFQLLKKCKKLFMDIWRKLIHIFTDTIKNM